MATASQVTSQADTQRRIVIEARRTLLTFWQGLDKSDLNLARDALMDFMPALVAEYGNAAGVAAAEFYDALRRDAATRSAFKAIIADADDTAVTEASRRLMGAMFDGNPEAMLQGLGAVIDKQVKQVYRDTVQGSAREDPARPLYARVPRGDTCRWCLMLASRGFVYASAEEAGGDGSRYHHDCDCVPTPEFSGSANIEGYDPDALYEQYQATAAAEQADIKKRTAEKVAEAKDPETPPSRVEELRKQTEELRQRNAEMRAEAERLRATRELYRTENLRAGAMLRAN